MMNKLTWIVAATVMAASSAGWAKRPLNNPAAIDLPPQNLDYGNHTLQMRSSVVTGSPLAWYDVDYAVEGATPEAMARQFLTENATVLGLRDASLADLQFRTTRTSLAGHNVHFDQYVDGVPVYKGRIVVHISPGNRVTHVANGYRPDAELLTTVPLVPASVAEQTVATAVNAQMPYTLLQSELVAYPEVLTTRLAWRVNLVPTAPAGDWEGVIDALTGETRVMWNSAPHVTGSAFEPDPLSSSGTLYGSPINDRGDADYPEIAAEVRQLELGDLTDRSGILFLSDEWAELVDAEGPFLGLFPQTETDIVYTREEQGFEATNVFYHVRHSMQYINETLGIELRPYQYPGGVRFDPHGLDGADNSHYVTSAGLIAFGEGCVDDSEDADVIWHELGHGLHDWVTDGGLSNIIDGLSEGFGDYWAQSYSRSLGQLQPGDEAYDYVFSWDGHNECWGGRITNYALPWPVGITPYPLIHTSGQIWSTCLMKIYDQIGRETTDAITLEGLAMTNGWSSQNDAANGVFQAAFDMGLPPEEVEIVGETLQSCGYVVAVTSLTNQPDPGSGDPLVAPSRSNAFVNPGAGALGLLPLLLAAAMFARRRG